MGKWTHRVAEALARRGHSPTLWFAEDFPLLKRAGRVSVLLFPVALALSLWRRRSQFDVAVVHEPSGLWYALLRRVFKSLPPMILICHNVESRHFGVMLEAARRRQATVTRATRIKSPLFRLWQSDGAIKVADHVVCLSSVDRDYIVRRLGRAPVGVTLQINGVASEDFIERRNAVQGRRVLFVGGWLDVKGRRVLPSIWSRVREEFPQATLTIIGSGLDSETVLADFDTKDHASVNVVTRVADEREMREQYAAHDVLLTSSLSEGSPLVLLEALAAGLPVVASRVGGIPDIVTDESDALLFDISKPEDGARLVCRLLSDADEAARLGNAGRERARLLTWDAVAQTLEATSVALSRVSDAGSDARRASAGGDEATSFKVIGE
jgi:glycosyltransferase involved in cell wall biosynthesis